MPSGRRRFTRKSGTRPYRTLFLVAVEGKRTEPDYFSLFQGQNAAIRLRCLPARGDSAPPQVVKRIEEFIAREGLRSSDEAWIVADRDHWTEDQLNALYDWSKKGQNRRVAVSNPCFEFWLLLHFEEGHGIATFREVRERLRRHLPDYGKGIDSRSFTRERIGDAIRRASGKDTPPSPDWPRNPGNTTVYRLVKKLLSS
jgi:hypothetical protein